MSLFHLKLQNITEVFEENINKEGLKVIEYNNINTSGLYGCDEVEIVRAINGLDLNR